VHVSKAGAYAQAVLCVISTRENPSQGVGATGAAALQVNGRVFRSDCGPTTIGRSRSAWCYGKTVLLPASATRALAVGYLGRGAQHDSAKSPTWPIHTLRVGP